MAETGSIPSIIDVASEGFRLSLLLNAVGCEVASAGVEVSSIAKGVTMFSSILKQTGILLRNPESVHSSEAVETVQEIAQECTLVFSEIRDMLQRVSQQNQQDGSTGPTVATRFKWAFKKGRVQYLLGQLDSLKLSLSVLLGILQLGTLMAATSKSDPPEMVEQKKGKIASERAEAQNYVIVRYWQVSRMDRLYEAARHEEDEDKRRAIEASGARDSDDDNDTQLTIEAPPEYMPSSEMAKMSLVSLGDIDQKLHQIRNGPRAMVQISDEVIDPLLDRWTTWHQVRERRHQRDSSGGSAYSPSVEPVYDDDEDRPPHQKFQEREESPHQGNLLEGGTTDWRKPHSVEARHEAKRLRRQYAGYQPSVSVESSDQEDSPTGRGKYRSPRHHIIDSSSDSSDFEREQSHRNYRRSASSTTEKKPPSIDGTTAQSSGSTQPTYGQAYTRSPGGTPRASMSQQKYTPGNRRPSPNPTQDHSHHSVSSPLPPIHTTNPLNPYAPSGTSSPNVAPMLSYLAPQQYTPVPRYMPPQPGRMTVPAPGRPVSQDGSKARSPGRPAAEQVYHSNSRAPQRPDYGISENSPHSRRSQHKTETEKKAARERTRRNLTEGAAKGLLGGGAIGIFLEALEQLAI